MDIGLFLFETIQIALDVIFVIIFSFNYKIDHLQMEVNKSIMSLIREIIDTIKYISNK